MRYYSIVLTNPTTGKLILPAGAPEGSTATYTSFSGGRSIPGARNVELDVTSTDFATPINNANFVRVWGISLAEISQANDLAGALISVFAGMQKGLPLANPAQAGLIAQGVVAQSFGNWVELDQTLDMFVVSGTGTIAAPKNITFVWPKGTKLSAAISNTLATAFPDFEATVSISEDLVPSETITGFYQTLGQFAEYLLSVSRAIVASADYVGVRIAVTEKTIGVFDGTTKTSPKVLAFVDLIGQPTWFSPTQVQFKTVMRADLRVGDFVKFPEVLATSTQAGTAAFNSGISQKAAFQGTFQITSMRHVGNFRNPNAESWVSTFDAFVTGAT